MSQKLTSRRKVRAIVPRSLLAYAGVGMGMAVIPLPVACSDASDAPPVGIAPAMPFDAGNDGADDATPDSVGIRVAVFDAGADTSPGSVGIRPAMPFDAGRDVSPTSVDGDVTASDAGGDASPTSVGIDPALPDAGGNASDAGATP